MRTLQLAVVVLATSLLLAACKEAPEPSQRAGSAATTPVSIAAVEAEARGFTVGSPMSARTVYVFFDPQCSHCAALWLSAKPLKSQAKFVWIPVSLLNKTSETIPDTVNEALLSERAEHDLFRKITELRGDITGLFERGNYEGAMKLLASLHEPVDTFFDKVMVMAEDSAVRTNRLALLKGGAVDIVAYLQPRERLSLKGDQSVKVVSFSLDIE